MYAFYDSMRIDMSLQFDFLPVRIRKHTSEQECAGQDLNTMETPEGATESISVECIAESVPKVTEKSTYITKFLDRSHAESFAEGPTKKLNILPRFFLWKLLCFASILLIMLSIITKILMTHLQWLLLILLRHIPELRINHVQLQM